VFEFGVLVCFGLLMIGLRRWERTSSNSPGARIYSPFSNHEIQAQVCFHLLSECFDHQCAFRGQKVPSRLRKQPVLLKRRSSGILSNSLNNLRIGKDWPYELRSWFTATAQALPWRGDRTGERAHKTTGDKLILLVSHAFASTFHRLLPDAGTQKGPCGGSKTGIDWTIAPAHL
jgi:hypothetical protein